MCGPSVNCVTHNYNLPPLTFIMQPIVTYSVFSTVVDLPNVYKQSNYLIIIVKTVM